MIIRLFKCFAILFLSLLISPITTAVFLVLIMSCFIYRTWQYVVQGITKNYGPLPRWVDKLCNVFEDLINFPGRIVPMEGSK